MLWLQREVSHAAERGALLIEKLPPRCRAQTVFYGLCRSQRATKLWLAADQTDEELGLKPSGFCRH